MEEKTLKEVYLILNKNSTILQMDEDDIQEVIIKILDKFDSYNHSKSCLKTWVYNVAKNYMIDKHRKELDRYKKQIEEVELLNIDEIIYPEDSNHDQLQKLQQAIEKTLDEREKDILFLFYNGNKFEDIAKELNINTSSAKTIAQRAKQKIKLFFDKNPN